MTVPQAPTDACVTVRGLHVRYGNGAHALRGVDLAIAHGEVVALVGESACGKSSLGHAVLGLLPADARVDGSVELGADGRGQPAMELIGLPAGALREVRGRRVGYVAQNPFHACDPLRTVGHHVASAWRVHGRRPPDGAIPALLASLDIDDAERRSRLHPHQWSGGMLQRASIAGGRALHPQLLIADEPTSALDADLARSILAALRADDPAVLLVTHDLSLAEGAADRVYVLYGGEIAEHGPVAEVLTRPRHPYTQALLAAVPRRRGVLPVPLAGVPPSPHRPTGGCAFASRCPLAHEPCSYVAPPLVNGVACHAVHAS